MSGLLRKVKNVYGHVWDMRMPLSMVRQANESPSSV